MSYIYVPEYILNVREENTHYTQVIIDSCVILTHLRYSLDEWTFLDLSFIENKLTHYIYTYFLTG